MSPFDLPPLEDEVSPYKPRAGGGTNTPDLKFAEPPRHLVARWSESYCIPSLVKVACRWAAQRGYERGYEAGRREAQGDPGAFERGHAAARRWG